MISDDLLAMQAKIAAELSKRPECFVTHPREVGVLRMQSETELQDFAHRNGWSTVRRLGGRQFQFYNDAFERLRNEEGE